LASISEPHKYFLSEKIYTFSSIHQFNQIFKGGFFVYPIKIRTNRGKIKFIIFLSQIKGEALGVEELAKFSPQVGRQSPADTRRHRPLLCFLFINIKSPGKLISVPTFSFLKNNIIIQMKNSIWEIINSNMTKVS